MWDHSLIYIFYIGICFVFIYILNLVSTYSARPTDFDLDNVAPLQKLDFDRILNVVRMVHSIAAPQLKYTFGSIEWTELQTECQLAGFEARLCCPNDIDESAINPASSSTNQSSLVQKNRLNFWVDNGGQIIMVKLG